MWCCNNLAIKVKRFQKQVSVALPGLMAFCDMKGS